MTDRDSVSTTSLPRPDAVAIAHSERLIGLIRQRIDAGGGAISFQEYMHLALYAPGLGYYSAGAAKFGAGGDFITAPEVSPLFSRCLAIQIEQVLANFSDKVVMEVGAGSGKMASDMLLELRRRDVVPDRYLILEVSADLRERQRAQLQSRVPELLDRVRWLDAMPGEPFDGAVVANELLDAMPVRRFVVQPGGPVELGVCWTGTGFGWHELDGDGGAREQLAQAIPGWVDLPVGYRSELNPALCSWFGGLGSALGKGAVLLVDYGYAAEEYYLPERSDGTLLCHYQHRAHSDPFVFPGLQDITASVDFTAVAAAAGAAGFELAGYASQAHFLLGSGLDELMQEMSGDDIQQQLALSQQVKTLTMPGEMGERFKVIGLTKGIDAGLRGFSLQDMSALL